MPDLWMDVDAALSEVPINIAALTDDTDFKTREESVVYNQAGLDLVWNFVTTAGAMTQTAVTPTSAGVHDWVNQGNGMYSIEIPASGGTINNDTEGVGWFTGYATGILPWRGPTIGFRRAALNDMFIDGSTASTNMEDFFDGTGYAGGTTPLNVNAAQISGDATAADNLETMLDGTGGQVLSLKQLNVVNSAGDAIVATSSGSNGHGINASGNGSGAGIKATGGASGIGLHAVGGVTTGDGATFEANGNGNGLQVVGTTSGSGLLAQGDARGAYIFGNGGAGIEATGSGANAGIKAQGGGTGNGLEAVGGGTSGSGINATATSGDGLTATGGTNGHGINATGAGTGDGMQLTKGASGADLDADITGNVTGNLSGSVGSVTGAVGSVTGNVGGNVTGSVGSVAAGGITASSIAADAIGASELAADAVAEIADAVWDEVLSGHLAAGTTGNALNAAGAAGDPWSTSIPGAYGAGTAGYIVGTYVDAAISAVKAKTDNLPASPAAVGSAMTLASAAIAAATFASGAITADAIAGNAIGASELASDAVTEIAAGVWNAARATYAAAGTFGEGVASVQGNVTGSVASVTGAVGSVTGAVGSVTGNVGGNVTGSVGSVATGGITAASIAADAIGASELAADAVTEIVAGVWNAVRATYATAGTFGQGAASVQGNVTGSVGSVTGAVGSVTGNVGGSVASVTGAVGSVTGNVGGNVTGSVGSVAAGGITAASIATDAIDADALAADAVAEVVTGVWAETDAEPAAVPAAGATLKAKISWLFTLARNKVTQTATTQTVFADDGSTSVAASTTSDDGTTFTRGEFT